ncbi:DUF2062 domain-containing protein [Gammaproteobacteria bacterium AS21]|jgi:uncharacterized protein (DUF2062 family)
MPRKFIKKYMPSEQKLRSNPYLKWLSKYLNHPPLWQLNRKSVSKGFLVGIFCAFLPIPMQMLVAAMLAILIRSNLIVSVGLVWITNPITIPPIFYFTYKVGTHILGTKPIDDSMVFGYQYIIAELASIWWPLITGSLVCATIFSISAYLLVNILWVWNVKNSWKNRRLTKRDKSDDNSK